jgi:glycosyltransferase involved in cell wall biosynthesis
VVAHIRNPHDKLLRRQRHLLRLVAYFIFVSEHARRHFDFDVPSGRASVVYDGLDIADDPLCGHVQTVRAELAVPDRAKLVGMIARLAPQKDHTTFLRAARRIVTALPKTRFVVVGDHSGDPGAARQFEALQQLTDELGIASSVTFTGFRSDVPRLLAAMDVVVLATHFEGFGLSLLEAMAHGRPVVATAVGGIPELVVDNETGLLHRPGDDEHLATQVLSLLCDEAGARRLAKAGRDRVGRSFTGATSCGGAEKVYRRLVKVS